MVRPRTVCPPDDELGKLGEELLSWACASPEHLFMGQFYSVEKHILRKDWKSIVQNPLFLPYYEEAQMILGYKHATGALKDSIAHRFLRLYHHDVKSDEDEVAAAKNKANSNTLNAEEFIKAIREDMNARAKTESLRGVSSAIESVVEAEQSILHQGCVREQSPIST